MAYYEHIFEQPDEVSEPLVRYLVMTAPRPRRQPVDDKDRVHIDVEVGYHIDI